MAKKAKVLLEWSKSISTDVVEQRLQIVLSNESVPIVGEVLPASLEQYEFVVPEKRMVHVELRAYDGTNTSDPAVLDFEIGDLTAPQPPEGLVYTVLEVFDDNGSGENTPLV